MDAAPLVVVTGPPGAGKSTVAELLVQRWSPSALVAGDAFFGFLRRGAVAPWLPEAHAQNEVVVAAAAGAAGRLARGGTAVVYDGVVGPWFLEDFAAAAGTRPLHYTAITVSLETCLARVASRTGHGFTDAAAATHMWHDFADAGLDPRHVVDGEGSPDDLAARIAALVASGTASV